MPKYGRQNMNKTGIGKIQKIRRCKPFARKTTEHNRRTAAAKKQQTTSIAVGRRRGNCKPSVRKEGVTKQRNRRKAVRVSSQQATAKPKLVLRKRIPKQSTKNYRRTAAAKKQQSTTTAVRRRKSNCKPSVRKAGVTKQRGQGKAIRASSQHVTAKRKLGPKKKIPKQSPRNNRRTDAAKKQQITTTAVRRKRGNYEPSIMKKKVTKPLDQRKAVHASSQQVTAKRKPVPRKRTPKQSLSNNRRTAAAKKQRSTTTAVKRKKGNYEPSVMREGKTKQLGQRKTIRASSQKVTAKLKPVPRKRTPKQFPRINRRTAAAKKQQSTTTVKRRRGNYEPSVMKERKTKQLGQGKTIRASSQKVTAIRKPVPRKRNPKQSPRKNRRTAAAKKRPNLNITARPRRVVRKSLTKADSVNTQYSRSKGISGSAPIDAQALIDGSDHILVAANSTDLTATVHCEIGSIDGNRCIVETLNTTSDGHSSRHSLSAGDTLKQEKSVQPSLETPAENQGIEPMTEEEIARRFKAMMEKIMTLLFLINEATKSRKTA